MALESTGPTFSPQDYSKLYSGQAVTADNNLPSNFVGPVQPGQTIGGVNPLQQTSPAPQQSGGGGGGGGAGGQSFQDQWQAAGHPGTAPVGYHGESGPSQGPSQDDINNAINDTYNASNQYLDQAEANVRSDFPTVQADINSQYGVNKGQLDTQNAANLQQFGTQSDQAGYQNQNALSQSRRLYSDLRQGYQQRFGGATSAGDAANELANVEQQRQQGQTNRSYNDTMTSINNNKTNVENQYQQGIQALATQHQTAMNQAQRDFSNKLLTISQSRAQNEQAKGQQRLQALQDLRNQIFSINQQNTQFQQSLEAMRQQGAIQLQNYEALAGQGVSGGAAALGVFNQQTAGQPTSQYQVGGTQAPQNTQNLTGAISGRQPNYQLYPTDGFSH